MQTLSVIINGRYSMQEFMVKKYRGGHKDPLKVFTLMIYIKIVHLENIFSLYNMIKYTYLACLVGITHLISQRHFEAYDSMVKTNTNYLQQCHLPDSKIKTIVCQQTVWKQQSPPLFFKSNFIFNMDVVQDLGLTFQ